MKPSKGRKNTHAGLLRQVRNRIDHLAREHDCSKSFVQNVLLAEQLGIEIEEHYEISTRQSSRRVTQMANHRRVS